MSTVSYFSNGVVSRADLKYRLKAQKIKQKDAFRNTMKDLSHYLDIPMIGERDKEIKSSTAAPYATGNMTQDIFSEMRYVRTQQMPSRQQQTLADTGIISPNITTILERPNDESKMSSLKKNPNGVNRRKYNTILI